MKRYAVFAMESYYPGGGWSDLHGLYDDKDEAFEAAKKVRCDWYEVVDLEEGVLITEGINE